DALRSRLSRAPADVVGVVFSTSGLTKGAVEVIEANRSREILVVTGLEIGLLRSGEQSVVALLERKREALRAHGRFWAKETDALEFTTVQLPRTDLEFRLSNTT